MSRPFLSLALLSIAQLGFSAEPDSQKLWAEVDKAKQITFHCLYRHPGLTQRMSEVHALEEIIRQLPGTLDEARARLRIAKMCDEFSGNLAVRLDHIDRSHALLRKLMKSNAGLEGLPTVLFEAAGTRSSQYVNEDAFRDEVRKYLEARFQAGGADAAEAGFQLGRERIIKERNAYRAIHQQVVQRYRDTHWGQYAQLHLLRNDSGRPLNAGVVDQLHKFAEKHRGNELGLKALKTLSFWHGRNNDKDRSNPVGNWTKAMEVNIQIAHDYPGHHMVELYCYEPKFGGGDVKRFEDAMQTYFAINKPAWTYQVRQIAKAKKLPEDSPEFYIDFWDAVERRCKDGQREAVVANRARFFYEWGRYKREHEARTEMFRVCEQALKDFPKSVHAPEMLDLMARALLEQDSSTKDDRKQAAALWTRLLESYPDHPVARWVALDLALLAKVGGDLKEHRRQLNNIADKYSSDQLLAVAVPYLLGESFEREKDLGPALHHYTAALNQWDRFSPALIGRYLSLSFSTSSQPWQVRFSIDHAKVRKKVALWKQFASTKFRDLLAWQAVYSGDGDVRRKHLEKFVDEFKWSKLIVEARTELAHQYEIARDYDKARAIYASVIRNESARPEEILVARLAIAKLNALHQGKLPKLKEKQTAETRMLIKQLGDAKFATRESAAKQLLMLGPAVHVLLNESIDEKDLEIRTRVRSLMQDVVESELRSAFEDYKKTISGTQPDALGGDVAEIQRQWWVAQYEMMQKHGATDEQQVPAEQPPNPWYLVSSDVTAILADGQRFDLSIEHRFEPVKNAATLDSKSILNVARALDIPLRLASKKSDAKVGPKPDIQILFEQARNRVLPVSHLRYGRMQPTLFF